MAENRFFLETNFTKGASVELLGDEAHHLTRVMRREKGDIVELVNGKSQLALAEVREVGKNKVGLLLKEVSSASFPLSRVILVQAFTRPKNLDLIIEKGTELGATAFYLFPGDRSEKTSLSENQLTRLKQLSIAALKQSGRLDLPSILEKPPLSAWKSPQGHLFFGDLDPNAPFLTPSPDGDSYIFIGPEKGFSPEEEQILRNSLKAKGMRFNRNILRAETAALCALSILNCK